MAAGSRWPWWCATNTPLMSARCWPKRSTPLRVAATLSRFRVVTKEIASVGARDEDEVEGDVPDPPSLTSANDDESSGGETRTLNLAGLFKDNLELRFSRDKSS